MRLAVWLRAHGLCDDASRCPDSADRRRPPELPRDRAQRCSRPRASRSSARRRTGPRRSRRPRELHPEVVLLDVQLPDLERLRGRARSCCGNGELAGGRARLEPRRGRLRRADPGLRRARVHPEGRALRREHPRAPRLSSPRVRVHARHRRRRWPRSAVRAGARSSRATTRRTRARRPRSPCTAGVSFIAAGLIALYRRPENRTGVYLAAVGYLWFLAALTEANNDVVFTLGVLARQPRVHPVRRARARVPDGTARAAARPAARAR